MHFSFNQDTLVNIFLIMAIIVLAFNAASKIAKWIAGVAAGAFVIFFLFIWTPSQMTTCLRMNTYLPPQQVSMIQASYQNYVVIGIRKNIIEAVIHPNNATTKQPQKEQSKKALKPPAKKAGD